MTLLNPLGLIALIAIPIVIAIHFLQRRAVKLPISTLFLLQQTQRETASGRKFDRLMPSIPLWLQLLIILLATWLLVQPRYTKANSTQRIAIVLDSSASMAVFKPELKEKLKTLLPELQGNAEQAEYWLLLSNTSRQRLYHGTDLDSLLASIDKWTPVSGAVDPTHGLRIARSLASAEGAVVYLTDTPKKSIPYNAHVCAIGSNKANCGFTGISFTRTNNQLLWKTLIRNYSDKAITRTWHLETKDGKKTAEKTISIEAGKIATLQGPFPKGATQIKLQLSPDSFPLDDTLPIIRPNPKTLLLHTSKAPALEKLATNITTGFPNIVTTPDTNAADIDLCDQTNFASLKNNSILFNLLEANKKPTSYLTGAIVADKHPLTQGLNWQTLLIQKTPALTHTETDEVLLWQGTRPLIFLRPLANKKQALIFNFDLNYSNIRNTEAAVVLMLRFTESIRDKKLSHYQAITETSQPLKLTLPNITKETPLSYSILSLAEKPTKTTRKYNSPRNLYAPEIPCFYTISAANSPLLTAANYFADTREADFRDCATDYLPASTNATAINRHTKQDHLWRYWAVFILIAALISWHYASKPSKQSSL